MRLVMILNQIQAGMGTKDDVHVPLTATKEVIGPGVTLKPLLAEHEQNLLVTIYMGEQTYRDAPVVVQRKIKGMLQRLNIEGGVVALPLITQSFLKCHWSLHKIYKKILLSK